MVVYNTFRSLRYLRTLFTEGRYLLSSEATDIELEMIDSLRKTIQKAFGDISIGDAWKVLVNSQTQLLINPGTSWVKGLPFTMRDGRDHLVTGAVSIGQSNVPTGVTFSDSDSGKLATFTIGSTPSGNYTVVISATEETIDYTQDPFLQNVDVPEATASKKRLVYGINIVPTANQNSSPIPYEGDGYFGSTGKNLVNDIIVTCPTGVTVTNLGGTGKNIDGRSYEISIPNSTGAIPATGSYDAIAFTNGKLVDTSGKIYWLNGIVLGTNPVTLRIDAEIDQPAPTFTSGQTFTLTKADVYSTSDAGASQGKLFLPVATINWDITSGFVHSSVVNDFRKNVLEQDLFEDITNKKPTLQTINGGNFSLAADYATLTWSSAINLVGPSVQTQTIAAATNYLVDGGFLVYNLNLGTAGTISKGNLAVTSTTSGTSISLSGVPDLSSVSKGNIFVIGTESAEILDIDNINKTLTLATSVTTTGAATIYLDSYASLSYITDENTYVLATRSGNYVSIANLLVLTGNQSSALGVKLDPLGAIISGANGLAVKPDGSTLDINVSDQLEVKPLGITDAQISATANIAITKLAPLANTNRVLVSSSTGEIADNTAQDVALVANSLSRGTSSTTLVKEYYVDATTLTDNSSAVAVPAFQFAFANYAGEEITYIIETGAVTPDIRLGTLRIVSNGTTTSLVDTYNETADCGVSWSYSISAGNVLIEYTTTLQSTNRTMRADLKIFRK